MRHWQDDYSHRRELAACKNSDYDPVVDDYEMITMPAEPEDCDEEKKTIQRQIASLSSRIAAGGQGTHVRVHAGLLNDFVLCVLAYYQVPLKFLTTIRKRLAWVSVHRTSFLAQWEAFSCNITKVKEDLAKELAMRGILRHKTMDVPDIDLLSTLSTIAAWISSAAALRPRRLM